MGYVSVELGAYHWARWGDSPYVKIERDGDSRDKT